MKNTFLKFAAAATLALTASAASAALYDFTVVPGLEQAVDDGTDVAPILAGVPVSTLVAGFAFDGDKVSGDASKHAYLDQSNNSGAAGIGVCSSVFPAPIGDNACAPSSDDNITGGEALGVSFGTDAILNSLTLRGPTDLNGQNTHGILDDGNFLYSLTGQSGSFQIGTTDASGVANFGGLDLGNGLLFLAVLDFELYLSAADVDGGGDNNVPPSVPLPAGGLLLLTGLAGLGVARRRAKK